MRGPGMMPSLDGLLQPDVGVAGALGAQIAHRREAGHRAWRAGDCVARATRQRERLVQHLVVPGGLVVGVQQQVRMALDQARHRASCPAAPRARRPRAASAWPPARQPRCVRPRTTTAQPSCIAVPSNTRARLQQAGRRRRLGGADERDGKCGEGDEDKGAGWHRGTPGGGSRRHRIARRFAASAREALPVATSVTLLS